MTAAAGCWRVPQVTADPLVFKELDALYTAVTGHNPELLNDCQARLAVLYDQKHLEAGAYRKISGFIDQAEQGEWKSAAEGLYRFMRAQRKHPR